MTAHFPTYYQEFIYKSRYAKWLPDQNRREDWPETITRYLDFMASKVKEKGINVSQELYQKIYKFIYNLEVMPSMRSMMTAGIALDRDNTCGYNCSYLPIDSIESFDEAMFILMCGTGVGFSVEKKNVEKLPTVPKQLIHADSYHVVEDSKEGWAKALRILIESLYFGYIIPMDTSQIRPAGERLKTFGGRASGPEPLRELFKFVIDVFQNAKGRKLKPIECHDIMCKIGDIVVVGGVRRSAMISLSDLDDIEMRDAKSGEWWLKHPYRALSNNSAVYEDKPDEVTFLKEWTALIESNSGERGIFNRKASKQQAARNKRRDSNQEFGTNPCSEIILRPYQFCNLSEVVVKQSDNFRTLKEKVEIATILGTWQSLLTDFPYLRKTWKENTEEERLLGVSLTGIYDNTSIIFDYINHDDGSSVPVLKLLKNRCVEVNKEWAEKLGINQSTAITCVN